MTQGQYRISLDLNQDAYFAEGVNATDAANRTRKPARLSYSTFNAASATFYRDWNSTDQNHYWLVDSGTTPDAGFVLGEEGYTNGIKVIAGTEITITLDYKGNNAYSGEQIAWYARAVGGNSSATTTVSLFGVWLTSSVTFTPNTNFLIVTIYRTGSTNNVSFLIRNLVVVDGSSAPSAYNTGDLREAYEDITDYVREASWNTGMDSGDQDVASPSRCMLVVDNQDGHFNQDGVGAELVTNGDFTTWTGSYGGLDETPTGWTVGAQAGNIYLIEQGFDGLAGTDSCTMFVTGLLSVPTEFRMSQTILTVGQTYLASFDIGAFFFVDGSNVLRFYSGTIPISERFTTVGHHEFIFVAPSTDFSITNDFVETVVTFDNVSVKAVPRYYGLPVGTLVSIVGSTSSTDYGLYRGRLLSMSFQSGALVPRLVTMEFDSAMSDLSEMEYKPVGIVTSGATVGSGLQRVFENIPFAWPYIRSYFYLGASILSVDSWLFNGTSTSLALGSTTFAYEGDVATGNEKGVAAASYIRDLVTAEMGGRFFIDPFGGFPTFIGRNTDDEDLTVDFTWTDDNYESMEMGYGDDILNSVTIWYKQRRIETSNVVLWSSENSITIQPGETKRVQARYRDPSSETTSVSSTSIEPLARGLDYVISPANNYNKMSISAETGAQSATFTIENNRKTAFTVTTLQLRGVPVYTATEQSVTAINEASVYRNNVKDVSYNLPLIGDSDTVQIMANGLVNLYGEAISLIKSLTFEATKTSTRLARALQDLLGWRITVSHTATGHSRTYILVGSRHRLVAGGEHSHTVTWILKSADRIAYWHLGTAGRSELGTTSIPAF